MIEQLDKLAASVERKPGVAIAAICSLYLACSLLTTATRLLWFDELHLIHIARLPGAGDVIRFYATGLDIHTPVCTLIERASAGLAGNNFAGSRAPFILGYLLFCLCLYQFVRGRAGALWGLAAMTFPLVCPGLRYATEIRPYGLVLGFSALAALCWREAGEERRRRAAIVLLWLSLTFCVTLHYFAAFLAIPFGLAELSRWRQLRRADWTVAAAIATAPLVIVVFVPAMRKARLIYAAHIWATPHWSGLKSSYSFLLSDAYGVITATVFLCLLTAVMTRKSAGIAPAARAAVPLSERTLCAALALLPIVVVPASFLTGVFNERYVTPALTGITLSLILLAWRACGGNRLMALVASTVFLGWFVMQTVKTATENLAATSGYPFRTALPYAARPWMPLIAAGNLPVVIAPGLFFLPFQYYAPAAVQSRTYYLASREHALQFDHTDSIDSVLIHLAETVPRLNVASYDEFLRRQRKFLLLADVADSTWILGKLVADGAHLELLLRSDSQLLFTVTVR